MKSGIFNLILIAFVFSAEVRAELPGRWTNLGLVKNITQNQLLLSLCDYRLRISFSYNPGNGTTQGHTAYVSYLDSREYSTNRLFTSQVVEFESNNGIEGVLGLAGEFVDSARLTPQYFNQLYFDPATRPFHQTLSLVFSPPSKVLFLWRYDKAKMSGGNMIIFRVLEYLKGEKVYLEQRCY